MPKKKAKEKPPIIFKKDRRGLVPATAYDQEEFERLPLDTSFEVKPIDARGHDQLGFYWAVLNRVVDAVGRWPNAEKLHDAVKRELGYLTVSCDLAGRPHVTLDSIALNAMSDDERKQFIERAMAAISEAVGFDPVTLLPERKQAA